MSTPPRRKFIKEIAKAGTGTLLLSQLPISVLEAHTEQSKTSKAFTINLLQTTDVHCQIHPHDELFWENGKAVFRKTGGYAYLATYFKQERKKHPHTFVIDTGDMIQGSELSVKTTGKAMVDILNTLRYDAYLPGNWEVIYYKKAMESIMASLNAPKVCANMYHDIGNGVKGDLIFQPYLIKSFQGFKIGFIGYTDPLVPIRQSPNYSKGIIYTKPEEDIAKHVTHLREQEGCHMIIVLAHLGLSQQIALSNHEACKGVDYIFGGDTHERVRKPIQGKYAKIVEPGAFGSFVGKLTLTVQNNALVNEAYELVEIGPKNLKADKETLAVLSKNETPFKQSIDRIVGYSKLPLYRYFVIENTIDTFILGALAWQIKEADIVLSNGFRFCPPRTTPDHTGMIPITEGFIYDMLPVDSVVKTAQVSGKQIKEWLEKELNNVFAENAQERIGGWVIKFKGMHLSFYAYKEKGKRIHELTIQNQPVIDDKIYTICACERDGDPDDMLCRIKQVKNAKQSAYTLHQVMTNYLQNNSPVEPTLPKSCIILDGSQDLLTQVWNVDYTFR